MASYDSAVYNDQPIQYPIQTTGRLVKYTPATADTLFPVINDYINFFKMPRGAKVLDMWIAGPDLDTGGPTLTLTARLTDGTTNKDFITASTGFGALGAGFGRVGPDAAGIAHLGYIIPNGNFYWKVFAPAAATTPVAGSGGAYLQLYCLYTMDVEYGESVMN